jgi:hypothetical protein
LGVCLSFGAAVPLFVGESTGPATGAGVVVARRGNALAANTPAKLP